MKEKLHQIFVHIRKFNLFFNYYFNFCFIVFSLFLSLIVDMISVWLVLRLFNNAFATEEVI